MPPTHVYGPVPSRRLGRSLGVDLVPFKVCTYDCIYCQLGRTTQKTLQPAEHSRVEDVLIELACRMPLDPCPDAISLAGSGEPTLHAGLGDIVSGIKRLTDVPVAVLTNGSLLWMPEVRARLMEADIVLPSLDAGNPEIFARVNRPDPRISFEAMVDGLTRFAHEYRGMLWLEVFLLAGITEQPERVAEIASIVRRVQPALVQLNTVARPPADRCALAVPTSTLHRLAGVFDSCPVEVIAEAPRELAAEDCDHAEARDRIVDSLARRPSTIRGLAQGLGLHPNEVVKHLRHLCDARVVQPIARHDGLFYSVSREPQHQGDRPKPQQRRVARGVVDS